MFRHTSIESREAAQLLNDLGRYLHFRARLIEAESLYEKSLEIREKVLGPDHLDVATSLHNLGWLYYDQSRYSKMPRHPTTGPWLSRKEQPGH